MSTRRQFLEAAGVLAAASLVPRRAFAEARPAFGGALVGSVTSAPASFDPVAAWSHAEISLCALVFDTLYRVDARGRAEPHLAAGPPEPDQDGAAVRIPLLAGVRFHDGRELGPADVAASLLRAAAQPAGEWALAGVSGITAEAGAVRLALHRPQPDLALALAAPALAVTPGGKAPPKLPVGSGPFAITGIHAPARKLELAAWAGCFAGRAFTTRATLRWFERPDDEARAYEVGDADFSLRGAVAFAGHQPKHPTASVDGPATVCGFVGFGRAHTAITSDVAFRRALSLAMARTPLRHLGAGERVVPSTSAASPDLGGKTPAAAALAARPADARAALDEATRRHPELKKPPRLALIADRTRLDDAEIAARVVTALDSLGLPAGFETLAPDEFTRRVAAGACDLWLGQLVAPTSDPAHAVALAFAAGGDRTAASARRAGRFDLAAAEAELERRWPVVPLYHRAVRAHHKQAWDGVGFDAQGRLALADVFALGKGA